MRILVQIIIAFVSSLKKNYDDVSSVKIDYRINGNK